LTDAQRSLLSEPDIVSDISFKVDDLYHADRIAARLNRPRPGLPDHQLMAENPRTFRALQLEQIVTFTS